MNTRKLLISAALISTLVFGANAALAQDDSTPSAETQGPGFGGPRGPMRGEGFRQGPQQRMPGQQFGSQMRFRIGDGWLRGVVEEYSGLSFAELREAHQNGQTLAELIEANGQNVDDFIATISETLNTHIDALVENGRITAERAEELKALAQERLTARINGQIPEPLGPMRMMPQGI